MTGFLKDWVFNIVSLSIFIVLVEIIAPEGKTKKFIHLVTGFIMVIAIISPFFEMFGNGVDIEVLMIKGSNFVDRSEMEKAREVYEEEQVEEILRIYKENLKNQIKTQLSGFENLGRVNVEVLVDEDYHSESFGELRKVYLNIAPEEVQKTKDRIHIEPVEITRKSIENPGELLKEHELDREIRKKISLYFGIPEDRIVISAG